jgi:TatD DNase family protein
MNSFSTPPSSSLNPSLRLIDSHCHLDYDYDGKSIDQLLEEAHQTGVKKLITIGVDFTSSDRLIPLSAKYSSLYFTLGLHPHEAQSFSEENFNILADHIRTQPRCVGVGEIGLDYFYDHSPREQQITVFKRFLALAQECNKPVIIHCRDAEEDMLAILKEFKPQGIIHCFTGTQAFGQACLDLGMYISFSGIITFKTAENLRQCVRDFPLEKILVETDSPYLAPVPYRGKKCEPSMVLKTAEKVAEIKTLPLEAIALQTYQNTCTVFNLPESSL